MMLILPEEKCEDQAHFEEGMCVPCPRGSFFNKNNEECQWCPQDNYFQEDLDNYFESQCALCPAGTVGGYEMECVPCDAGSVYDATLKYQHCRPCSSDKVCPVGTKYEFPMSQYAEALDEVSIRNVPETYKPQGEDVDKTATMVFLIWISAGVFFAILIILMNNTCKEKSLFIFRELDLIAVTGGHRKRWVGGIITVFYFLVIFVIIAGFVFHWLFYNR